MAPILLLLACQGGKAPDAAADDSSAVDDTEAGDTATGLPASPQRDGDADAGWQTLLYGDFVGSGVPVDVWFDVAGEETDNPLGRTGDSAKLDRSYNLFAAPNGVEVVGGITCLGCHASLLNGELVIGLGDVFTSYVGVSAAGYVYIDNIVTSRYGADSDEAAAWEGLYRGAVAVTPAMSTPFRGVNPAFSLERAAAAHRDPETLAWLDEPLFELPEAVIASDVPPWWNVKKKNALYYTALARGDFARAMTQTDIVGLHDADHAADIDADFPDVLAWILALEPPVHPGEVDAAAVAEGALTFEARCARCHGTYGDDETYPNRVIALDEIGTDPTYAEALSADDPFFLWLSESWYGAGDEGAGFTAAEGYLAPPLDGVWATAPYLHNGSVPDLVTLLDSAARPTCWTRDFGDSTYDLDAVGWPWEASECTGRASVYDTTVAGYGNGGHTYADDLDDAARAALVAYLTQL